MLRTIEHRIESLFEGIFGRAFRSHVQPVELARKLAKEMDDHRSVSVSRVYVPNEYHLYLSPRDREQFRGYEESLLTELSDFLAEHARREGYALVTRPRVLLHEDDDLSVGEFGIATRMAQSAAESAAAAPSAPAPQADDAGPLVERLPPPGVASEGPSTPAPSPPQPAEAQPSAEPPAGEQPVPPPAAEQAPGPPAEGDAANEALGSEPPAPQTAPEPAPEGEAPAIGPPVAAIPGAVPPASSLDRGSTRVFERPGGAEEPPPAEPPLMERFELVLAGRRYPLDRHAVTLGRSKDCDVPIDDPSVSRRHAELRLEGAGYLIVDLDSTNGTDLNGTRISQAALSPGDRITVGQTELRFERG